jgi:hypothetical protein
MTDATAKVHRRSGERSGIANYGRRAAAGGAGIVQASLLSEHISRAQQVTMLWRGSVGSEPVAVVDGVTQKRLPMTVFSHSQEVSRA